MIVYSNMTRTLRRAYEPRDLSITLGANAIAFEVGASDERLSVRISCSEKTLSPCVAGSRSTRSRICGVALVRVTST